jgi:hypothetical protein
MLYDAYYRTHHCQAQFQFQFLKVSMRNLVSMIGKQGNNRPLCDCFVRDIRLRNMQGSCDLLTPPGGAPLFVGGN